MTTCSIKGSLPDAYRPTMYDFLAHEALEFYSAGEQGATAAEDAFVLAADSPIFAPAAEFLTWRLETTDPNSPTVKAIRLYQIPAGIPPEGPGQDRPSGRGPGPPELRPQQGRGRGEERPVQGRPEAIRGRIGRPRGLCPCTARVGPGAAISRATCRGPQAGQAGPGCVPQERGGILCYNLVQQIEARSASIKTERVWNEPLPTIQVRYRNVTKVYFRAVPMDFGPYLESRQWSPYGMDEGHRQVLLASRPELKWSSDLPATEDYRERTERLPAPKDLKPGFYFILASHDPSFGEKNNQVTIAPVWVSDLALVIRDRHAEGAVEGFVLDGPYGRACGRHRCRTWVRDPQGRYRPGQDTKSDENGCSRFRARLIDPWCPRRAPGAATRHLWRARGVPLQRQSPGPRHKDRLLHRPFAVPAGPDRPLQGHLSSAYDQDATTTRPWPVSRLTVVFKDANGKEIARAEHRCNDYGSFSGSFTAPQDRLTGQMTIGVVDGPSGSTAFQRRGVQAAQVPGPARPAQGGPQAQRRGDAPGKATAYTGAAIGSAKVHWRVVRQVRCPVWWHWCFCWPPHRTASQAIAHGYGGHSDRRLVRDPVHGQARPVGD